MQSLKASNRARSRLDQLLSPDHPLCKDDVIWLLEYIKKKVAEKDPGLLDLSQPRLLNNFYCFAEVALMLIHRRPYFDQEVDRLREWLTQAAFGLDTGASSGHAKGSFD